MTGAVVGREPELEAAAQLLSSLDDGAAALIFEGEPGIGKTTVFRASLAQLAAGYSVLSCRPTKAEASANIAAGTHALYSNTDGSRNLASGYQALLSNTTGDHNLATGFRALDTNTTGPTTWLAAAWRSPATPSAATTLPTARLH